MSVTERLKMKRLLTLCKLLLHRIDTHNSRFPNVARREKRAMERPRKDLSMSVKRTASSAPLSPDMLY